MSALIEELGAAVSSGRRGFVQEALGVLRRTTLADEERAQVLLVEGTLAQSEQSQEAAHGRFEEAQRCAVRATTRVRVGTALAHCLEVQGRVAEAFELLADLKQCKGAESDPNWLLQLAFPALSARP